MKDLEHDIHDTIKDELDAVKRDIESMILPSEIGSLVDDIKSKKDAAEAN
jgi:hypothetical protein